MNKIVRKEQYSIFNFQFAICNLQFIFAGMAESADAPDLGSGGRPCRFDPCYPHHAKRRLLASFCNDIRSFPIPQNSLRSFRGPLGAPERVIYASHMISPSGVIYACGVLTGSPQNLRVLWGVRNGYYIILGAQRRVYHAALCAVYHTRECGYIIEREKQVPVFFRQHSLRASISRCGNKIARFAK